ncbi:MULTISPECIES: hypothetical protein [unclassified Bradyrhizobium]|uniref:hypothetical protein n=1 Tax=unclassified Bradyrhizobium TaxID=2631580 RepID=UPI0028E9DF5E|nr:MULTISPECIES: hypothetical protein [unclassified Bradyrhizobium]
MSKPRVEIVEQDDGTFHVEIDGGGLPDISLVCVTREDAEAEARKLKQKYGIVDGWTDSD